MQNASPAVPDVFDPREVARVAGVRQQAVLRLIATGEVASVGRNYLSAVEAVRAVHLLRASVLGGSDHELFEPGRSTQSPRSRALLGSAALHVLLAALVLLTTMGGTPETKQAEPV